MFGELVGLWLAQVWADQGRPDPFVLVELGPGRGTLMRDALRAARGDAGLPRRRARSGWSRPARRCARGRPRRSRRRRRAGPTGSTELPPGPLFVVANEFFDALPIRQFQRTDALWRERQVGLAGGRLAFAWASPRAGRRPRRAASRTCPTARSPRSSRAGEAVAARLGARIAARGRRGAHHRLRRLGRLRRHPAGRCAATRRVDPLDAPGRRPT